MEGVDFKEGVEEGNSNIGAGEIKSSSLKEEPKEVVSPEDRKGVKGRSSLDRRKTSLWLQSRVHINSRTSTISSTKFDRMTEIYRAANGSDDSSL